jgi:hypothetical protein
MTESRADLGFADALDDFDANDWLPRAPAANAKPPKVATAKAAAAAGFRSREPQVEAANPAARPEQPRRRRTGRNAQFNLKARPDTIEEFCAVADAQGWGLGETLEQAVALLQREYGAPLEKTKDR